jgi:hypothetical protein
MAEMLAGHVREHLGAEVSDPQQRLEDVQVVLSALHSYMK